METTSKVLNSTNSSEVYTYASAVITDYTLWYEGYWAAVEADLYDNGAWIDYNVGDSGFASAETRLSDPINLGHQYDAVATSALCWWVDEGDGFGYEDCSAVYSLDLYGILGKPQISSVNPSGGTIGKSGSITVQGQNLVDPFSGNASAAITGSGVTLTVQSNPSDSQVGLNFSIASNATAGNQTLTLSNRFGTSNGEAFTVGYPPAVVNNVSPSVWTAGQQTSVTITGTGFGSAPTLSATAAGVNLTLNSASPDGTTIHATATVAVNAPNESVTITVQPGYAGSGFYCNCPPDQANGTDTATVQANLPAPTITLLNGVTSSPFAGQPVSLSVSAASGFTISSQTWSFGNSNDVVAGYTASAANGCYVSVTGTGTGSCPGQSLNLIQTQLGKFYFIVPGPQESVYVDAYYNMADGSTAPAKRATQIFTVNGPTGSTLPSASLQTDDSATTVLNPNGNPATLKMTNSPSFQSVGVSFKDSATLPQGSLVWVQILQKVNYSFLVPTNSTWAPPANLGVGLDGFYPYPAASQNSTNDSPNVTLLGGLGEAAESFDAIMYVLWDPAIPPAGQPQCTPATTSLNYKSTASTCASIPVPLGSVEWKWSACTINRLAAPAGVVTPSWIKQCGPGFSYPAAAGGYPTWNSCDTSDIGKC